MNSVLRTLGKISRSGRPAYAYVALIAGTLGTIMTLPGQTNGIAPFIDFLIGSLPLERVWVSTAYMIGTAVSAFTLGYAGKAYDRFGARLIGALAALGLGLSVTGLTRIEALVSGVSGLTSFITEEWIALLALSAGFFCVRFFGQGVLSMVSRNMVMTWFNDHRGPASATIGVSMALASAGGPSLFNIMIGRFGWQATWIMIATVLIVFALFAFGVFRDGRKPTLNSTGRAVENDPREAQLPEGVRNRLPSPLHFLARSEPLHPEVDFSLKDAKRTIMFWVYCAALGLSSLVGTGFSFHVVDLMGEVGLTRAAALAIFVPASIMSVILQMGANIASDYIRLKYLVVLQIAGLILVSVAITLRSPIAAYGLAATGLAITTGLSGVLSAISWPRYFGITNLGAISGLAFSWVVAGSALGPYAFSLVESLTGSYRIIAVIFTILGLIIAILALYTVHPRRPGHRGMSRKQ